MDLPRSQIGVWQLRRVGPRSTVQNSASLIRLLEDGEVTIGRGPAADYFLDSAVTLRLISRIHATIKGDRFSNGHPQFTIINSGLNGTYINDYKMKCYPENQQVLLEGDKITFGHPGCASIQPGDYALQHDSEFQFIFECVPASRTVPGDRCCSNSRGICLTEKLHCSHQPKHNTILTAVNPCCMLTGLPQSYTSVAEKENEINSSLHRDVKSTLPNEGYIKSLSKHFGTHETAIKSTKLSKFGKKKSNVLCMEKKMNASGIDSLTHAPNLISQEGYNENVNISIIINTDINCSNVNKSSDSQIVTELTSCTQDKMTCVSPVYTNTLSSSHLDTSCNKPDDNLRREIEVHSTMIILSDEVDDESNGENSALLGDSDVEFITETGPLLPASTNVMTRTGESDLLAPARKHLNAVVEENKNSNIFNTNMQSIEQNKNNLTNIKNNKLTSGDVESHNNCTVYNRMRDNNEVCDEIEDVINDCNNLPSLILMKKSNSVNNCELNTEDSMPHLLLINNSPEVSYDSQFNDANSRESIFNQTQSEAKTNLETVDTKHNTQVMFKSSNGGECNGETNSIHSILLNCDSLPNNTTSKTCDLSSISSVTLPVAYSNNDNIQNVSLNLARSTRNQLSQVFYTEANREKYIHLSSTSENTDMSHQSSILLQTKSPSSSLILSSSASLLPTVSSHCCEPPILNVTTILLSSGNEHHDMSNKSFVKSSGNPSNKHKHHNLSLSSRSTSRSSTLSLSSEKSQTFSVSSPSEISSKSRSSSLAANKSSSLQTSFKKSSLEELHSLSGNCFDVSYSKSKSPLDASTVHNLAKGKQAFDQHLSNSQPSIETLGAVKLLSESPEKCNLNLKPHSRSTSNNLFKDRIPNMYSSSDEDNTIKMTKTEIVKKIYSSTKGKQEKDAGKDEVSRRSALFKSHKKSTAGDHHQSLAEASISPKPHTAEIKSEKSRCNKDKDLKEEVADFEKKISRISSEIKCKERIEHKFSEHPPTTAKTKTPMSKQVRQPLCLSLTSLPWLADPSAPSKIVKKFKMKKSPSKAGLLPRTTPLTISKNEYSSIKQSLNLTQSVLSTITPLKVSNEVSSRKTKILSEKASKTKSKNFKQSVTSSSRKTEHKKTISTTEFSHASKEDEDMAMDNIAPANKRRNTGSSTETVTLSKQKISQRGLHLNKHRPDSFLDKSQSIKSKEKHANDSVLSKSLSTKKKYTTQVPKIKKDKLSKARKKKRKIVSDSSSDDNEENQNNNDDDGDEDDICDMLEDEDDYDSDHSEFWDLPDGVQYYDNLCSAKKCLNPVGKQVDWVMCDACEQWYHVVCVNCPIDVVQNEDTQFNCGCC